MTQMAHAIIPFQMATTTQIMKLNLKMVSGLQNDEEKTE